MNKKDLPNGGNFNKSLIERHYLVIVGSGLRAEASKVHLANDIY